MEKINWGIIGCGDVTEVKSGPAFNKVPNSALVAVMRRNAAMAEDYARRHQVPRWYDDAQALIHDPGVNAIYIATPPSSHEQYALAALAAGKPVYLEKPVALNYESAKKIADAAAASHVKLTVAHYRSAWPLFKKLEELVRENAIGEMRLVRLVLYKSVFTPEQLQLENLAWRVNPAIAGGGIFHDLAPHQFDILYRLFGKPKKITGISYNQAGSYAADDIVSGNMVFEHDILFSGAWCFTTYEQSDRCEIIGSDGKISFSFFGAGEIELYTPGEHTVFRFEPLQHVQQPMIEKTVAYFMGEGSNPCSGESAAEVMRWIDQFTKSA